MFWLSQVLYVWTNLPYSKSTPKSWTTFDHSTRQPSDILHRAHTIMFLSVSHSPYSVVICWQRAYESLSRKYNSPQPPNQGLGAWDNRGHVCGWDEICATRQLSTGSSFKISHPNSIIQIHWSHTDLEHIIHIQLTGTIFTPRGSALFFLSLFQSLQKQGYIKLLSSKLSDGLGLQ